MIAYVIRELPPFVRWGLTCQPVDQRLGGLHFILVNLGSYLQILKEKSQNLITIILSLKKEVEGLRSQIPLPFLTKRMTETHSVI